MEELVTKVIQPHLLPLPTSPHVHLVIINKSMMKAGFNLCNLLINYSTMGLKCIFCMIIGQMININTSTFCFLPCEYVQITPKTLNNYQLEQEHTMRTDNIATLLFQFCRNLYCLSHIL